MKGACSAVCLPGVRGGSYRRMTQWSDRRQWPHFPFPEVVGTLIKFRERRQLTACMAVLCRIHSGTCMWGNSLSYFLHTPNRPLPSSKNPHFQNEAKCTNLSCENEFCLQGKKIISISKAELLTSFWYRGPGELGNGLLCAPKSPSFFTSTQSLSAFPLIPLHPTQVIKRYFVQLTHS